MPSRSSRRRWRLDHSSPAPPARLEAPDPAEEAQPTGVIEPPARVGHHSPSGSVIGPHVEKFHERRLPRLRHDDGLAVGAGEVVAAEVVVRRIVQFARRICHRDSRRGARAGDRAQGVRRGRSEASWFCSDLDASILVQAGHLDARQFVTGCFSPVFNTAPCRCSSCSRSVSPSTRGRKVPCRCRGATSCWD